MNLTYVMFVVPELAGVVLYVTIIAALVHKYRRTKDQGFLWLGVPLVILPLLGVPLGHWLRDAVDRLASGGRVGFFPFTLVEQGQMTLGSLVVVFASVRQLVWSGLILTAILMLHKAKPSKTLSTASSHSDES
jgi:hypothetical protein